MTTTGRRIKHSRAIPLLFVLVGLLGLADAQAMGMGGFGGAPGQAVEPTLVIEKGPLTSPLRVDINPWHRFGNTLLVTDHFDKAVYSVDRENADQVTRLFTVDGHPMALASAGPLVFVGNRSLGRIQVYRLNGKLLRTYAASEPMLPRDMAIDIRGRRLAVVDGLSRTVKLFNFRGRQVGTIDGFGDLYEPQGVAIESRSRKLVVTDFGDPRLGVDPSLQVFDRSGARLLKISGKDSFSSPRGVAVSRDRIFMVDALRGQVLVFDLATGSPLGSLGRFGAGEGELFVPSDVAYDRTTGKIFVTSRRQGRVIALDARTY